jgi:hypothetical protein
LDDLGVDGRILFRMDLREIRSVDVDCLHLAQDRDMRRAVVNTVMNLLVL